MRHAQLSRIHTFLASSDIHLEHKLNITRQECLETAAKMVAFTKTMLDDIEFSPEDAGRSDPDFLVELCAAVIEAAAGLKDAKSALFLGRGQYFPLACEGALKLKETSYIHAEAFPAGELKHGPLALVDESMPVFALAGSDPMLPKLASNIREVAARGGQIHVIGDREAMLTMTDAAAGVLTIPRAPEFVRPMVATVPLQLLSFHTATMRGLDVDRPRNLAKSVTVE